MVALSDLNQPYSCSQWGDVPNGGTSQIIEDVGYQIHTLFNLDNYFPSTIWIDHEMRVHDKMNNAGSWSVGARIDAMLEACGPLCEEGGCTTALGDVNEDEMLNIQDLITMVNHILNSSSLMDCALGAADLNADGIVNIQDLISLVNAILGSARSIELNGVAEVEYLISGEDLIIKIISDIDIAGVQLSLINDSQLDIEIKDNSHISQEFNFAGNMNRYLAYSIFNQPFDSRTTEILVHSAGNMDMENILLTVADSNGDALNLIHSAQGKAYQTGPHSFELSEIFPNPFNPSTQINFSLPVDEFVRLSAYDIKGNVVDNIFEGEQGVGKHSYTWNAASFPSGVYYIRLQAGDMITSQKVLLVK